MKTTVAALYIDPRGAYAALPGIDRWDETRDARLYAGPYPVVAHPPCTRWCQLAAIVEKRYGHKRGDDGGCFQAALQSVRTYGGVLEHPAYSHAWKAFNLPKPHRSGGWYQGPCGGWSTYVEQGNYGHPARKATWLYVYGATVLPALNWRLIGAGEAKAQVSWCQNHTSRADTRPRIGKAAAAATPAQFRDLLIDIARSVRRKG